MRKFNIVYFDFEVKDYKEEVVKAESAEDAYFMWEKNSGENEPYLFHSMNAVEEKNETGIPKS